MDIVHIIKRLISRLCFRFRHRKSCRIAYSANVTDRTTFEGMNQIFGHTYFDGHLGYGSYIGNNVYLSAEIGRFCSIAPFVRCNNGAHPYTQPYVSTAPCFCVTNPNRAQNGETFADRDLFKQAIFFDEQHKISIKIGHDCWIGEGAFLVGGIEISNGAVVLAHAVVTKDVPAYAIVGGIPARILGYRFDENTITFLQNVKWWDNSEGWFKEHWELLCNMEKFKDYYQNI